MVGSAAALLCIGISVMEDCTAAMRACKTRGSPGH